MPGRGSFARGTRFREIARVVCLSVVLATTAACGSTTDSLGYDVQETGPRPGEEPEFQPLRGPATYPNLFASVLGKTDAQIQDKLQSTFQLLFHGNDNQRIYFAEGDQARIEDIYHGDVRTEGMSYGMLIAVQLNRRAEFDRLWRYAKAELQYQTGPNRGYFRSKCSTAEGDWKVCPDPFGHQQFVMALLFANNRWGELSPTIDYAADARAVLEIMRNKEAENGGVVDGVTNMFDEDTALVVDEPHEDAAGTTRLSIEMPAFYELWAQATGDDFYRRAAAAAREHWRLATNEKTGLMPIRADFAGNPVKGSENFGPETYRTQINMALDQIWFGQDPWQIETSDRLLAFFVEQGLSKYGRTYTLEGAVVTPDRDPALVFANGATAAIATIDQRHDFIQAVWDAELVGGPVRYYHGLLDMVALLILSGQYRVY